MTDSSDQTKPKLVVLDYQTPQRLSLIQYLIGVGPWWVLPSWRSLVLVVLLAGAIVGLRHRPVAWKMGGNYQVTDINQPKYWFDYVHEFQPMPAHDAVFCMDGTGHACVWRPWDNRALVQLPSTNSPVEWLGLSGNESILMTGCNTDIFLWDAGDGKLLRHLTVGTKPAQIAVDSGGFGLYGAALSRNGSRLVTVGGQGELTLWEITGNVPRRLAKRSIRNGFGRPIMEFSPDDGHLLIQDDVTSVSVFDAETLACVLKTSVAWNGPFGRVFQWLDGGRKLVVVDQNGANATQTIVQVFDCQYGQPLVSWTFPNIKPDSVAVSSDNKHILIAVGDLGHSVCIDLSTPAHTIVRRTIPNFLTYWGTTKFFADGRRALISNGWEWDPVIVDVVNGAHLANLPLPAFTATSGVRVVGTLISADDQHVAAQLASGRVQVYDRAGAESSWGLMSSPWFALMAVILATTVSSLWIDAGKQTWNSGPCRGGAGMVVASIPALMLLCGVLGLVGPSVYVADRFLTWSAIIPLALWLPAGLCIRAGSSVWKLIGYILLCLAAICAFVGCTSAASFAKTPFTVFDRTMMFSRWQVMAVAIPVLLLSLALLIFLALDSAKGRPLRLVEPLEM